MSKHEYSFHSRPKQNVSQPSAPVKPQVQTSQRAAATAATKGSVKEIILGQYDHLTQLRRTDPQIKYLSETQEKISQEIVDNVARLQASPSSEEATQLNVKLNHLTDIHKQLKAEYTVLLQQALAPLYTQWPGIYDKVLEGINRQTLEHVLSVFEDYDKGRLDSNQAVNQGVDYMTMTYNLPRDFFDRNAIDQFNQGMHQM